MKTLMLIFSCLLLALPCQAAGAKEEQKAAEIEKYIASQQQAIETYYSVQLIELKQRAESEIRYLEIADKPSFAGLAAQAKVAEILLDLDSSIESEFLDHEIETANVTRDDYKPLGYYEHSLEIATERFAAAQSEIAERKSRILAKLAHESAALERQKNYALNVALPELEKQMKQNLSEPEAEQTRGAVTGIVYSADNPSAIVDGQIVHEGSVIEGVKVVKIHKDKVDFSRNGKSWGQAAGQSAEGYWK